MTQTALFVAIHIVGLVTCLAIGPHRRPALCAALGFSTGLAVICLVGLSSLIIGIPYSLATVAAIAGLATAGGAAVIARRGIAPATLKIASLWTLALAAVASAFAYVNLAIMSHDSFIFVMLGRAIGDGGGLNVDVIVRLDEWGVFEVVAHSLAALTDVPFLYGLPPMLGFTLIPVFALTLWHAFSGGPRWRRVAVIAVVVGAAFGNYMSIFHLFYLHTNMGSAVYLFGFVALFWLAETQQDATLLPIAFISLTAFALQRTETPLVAMIVLAIAVPRTTLPKSAITAGLALFTVLVGGWYEFLAHHVADEGEFLTPMRCRLVWSAMVAMVVWWLASGTRVVASINRALPAVVGAAFLIAVALAFAVRPDHMIESARNWGHNLLFEDYWGQAWFAILLLVALGLALESPPFRHVFTVGAPVYMSFVLLLALLRSPYKDYVDDSANRMTIHIVPVIFFYFALKLGVSIGLLRASRR